LKFWRFVSIELTIRKFLNFLMKIFSEKFCGGIVEVLVGMNNSLPAFFCPDQTQAGET